jgi:hypothetical protein
MKSAISFDIANAGCMAKPAMPEWKVRGMTFP